MWINSLGIERYVTNPNPNPSPHPDPLTLTP